MEKMINAELIRLEEAQPGIPNDKHVTIGVLLFDKQIFCFTLEPQDMENAVNISSIPEGQYICKRYSSERYPSTWQITGVPGRSYILFHPGNFLEDTEGCVVMGNRVDTLPNGQRKVFASGFTFMLFMKYLKDVDEFHLTVKNRY
jgi:hypothetical protein